MIKIKKKIVRILFLIWRVIINVDSGVIKMFFYKNFKEWCFIYFCCIGYWVSVNKYIWNIFFCELVYYLLIF